MALIVTTHAYQRLGDRLTLGSRELARILTSGHYVNIGREPGSDKEHRLFYSEPDGMCFVAVVAPADDGEDDAVLVTVLPVDYHENIAWAVSEHARSLAKRSLHEPHLVRAQMSGPNLGPVAVRFFAYTSDDLGAVKVRKLGSWPMNTVAVSGEVTVVDSRLRAELKSLMDELVGEGFRIEDVFARVGKKALPISPRSLEKARPEER